jgi:S-adenosylmethionine:tRNA ribosyltransferase-isomerase
MEHRVFSDLPEYLRPGDLLIVNDTKVIPARLFGTFEDGKSVEVLLVRPVASQCWEVLVRPAKRAAVGRHLLLACGHLPVTVVAQGIHGRRIIRLPADVDLQAILHSYGVMPLPPYIKRRSQSPEARGLTSSSALGSRLPRSAPRSGA